MQEVCRSPVIGILFGFPSNEYSTEPYWDWRHDKGYEHPWRLRTAARYDLFSVMHYDSGFARVERAPLTAWIYGAPGFVSPDPPNVLNSERIPLRTRVSERDAEAVRFLYPWRNAWRRKGAGGW